MKQNVAVVIVTASAPKLLTSVGGSNRLRFESAAVFGVGGATASDPWG